VPSLVARSKLAFKQCEAAVRQRPFPARLRGDLDHCPLAFQKVHIPILTIDAFLFMSHIKILETSKRKGNGHDDCGIRQGKLCKALALNEPFPGYWASPLRQTIHALAPSFSIYLRGLAN
jgi:hypothetical protein